MNVSLHFQCEDATGRFILTWVFANLFEASVRVFAWRCREAASFPTLIWVRSLENIGDGLRHGFLASLAEARSAHDEKKPCLVSNRRMTTKVNNITSVQNTEFSHIPCKCPPKSGLIWLEYCQRLPRSRKQLLRSMHRFTQNLRPVKVQDNSKRAPIRRENSSQREFTAWTVTGKAPAKILATLRINVPVLILLRPFLFLSFFSRQVDEPTLTYIF